MQNSSQIIDDDFKDRIQNITVLNDRGKKVIAIEFPNLRLGAELATHLGYDYNAENLWSIDAKLNYTCGADADERTLAGHARSTAADRELG